MIRGIILSVLALAYLMAGIVAYPEESGICESAKGKIVVSKKRITLIDISGNYVDSYDTKEEIKDYSIDPKGDFLFVVLGKPGSIRGERLAAFSITAKRIQNLWIDKDRGYNPWKVIAKDIDGDSQIEVCVGVWKKARFHPIFDNRLFIYGWDGDQIFPMWLGSRLSSPFTDFNFCDVDGDGIEELVALEIQRDGLKRVMAYKWKGFGFEGFKILKKEIKDETLSKSLMEEE